MSVADGVADLDLFLVQGAAWSKTLGYEEPEGNPLDISAWGAGMDIRRAYGDADAVLSLTKGFGITLDAEGMIRVVISDVQTGAMPIPEDASTIIYAGAPSLLLGVYDLFLFPNAAMARRVMQGRVFISPRATT